MATIEAYTASGKTLYRVRYRTPDRKQTSKRGFATKRDAREYLHNLESSKSQGTFVDPADSKATIAVLGAVWLAGQSHLKPSSLRPVESAWRLHVAPKWGTRQVGTIRHSDVQAWVTALSSTHSPSSVLRVYGVLAGILDVAVKDRRIPSNPARGVNLPRKTAKRKIYLTHTQAAALASAAGRHALLVETLAYTGLRWGEATGLRVRDVNLEQRRLNVHENAVMVGTTVIVGTPKTHIARSVPYPKFLAAGIRELAESRPSPAALLFGDGFDHMRLPNSRDGWFAAAVKRAQAQDPSFPRVTPHDLRHSAASFAISAGANVKAVQRMLGHASAAMTLDVYADLFDDDLNAVSDALDQARSAANVSTSVSTS
ncbi:site-specific integrase [Microbacterium bovistercoris]|uniref:Site-specific integrase n=1 Tax=Microbacterium bovistercoris TaxID=2293570 RepID=A0A371NUW8_9MICO|nr:site-specific integrase [Microbacterium bovistercoris]REJ06287.1 site-specific integrase [Microbacterium bovistercoris]